MRGKPVLFQDFRGGLNTAKGPYALDPNEARDVRNVIATPRGAIRKRDGCQAFGAPSAEVKSVFAGNTPDILLAASASIIYKVDSAGAVSQLKTGLSNNPWEWIKGPVSGGQGPFYGLNGSDVPVFYDGASAATGLWTAAVGAVPNGKYVLFHGNRVWVAGVAANPSRLYFSNLNDARDWPVANVVDFEPNDGEVITGIGTVGPYVLVFKTSKVFLVTNLDTGANRQLVDGVGAIAHRSIAETPIGTIFLSRDQGVMVTNGSRVDSLSDKIKPTLDQLVPAARSLAAAAYFNKHYYLAVALAGGQNSALLDYDVTLGSWWLHSLALNDLTVWDVASALALYGAPATTSRVDRCLVPGVTQDNGVNFEAYWKGPWLAFGIPSQRKRLRAVHFDGKGRIVASLARDFSRGEQQGRELLVTTDATLFGGAGTYGGTGNFGGARDVSEAKLLTPGVARTWSVVFGNNTADSFEVESMTFALTGRKD